MRRSLRLVAQPVRPLIHAFASRLEQQTGFRRDNVQIVDEGKPVMEAIPSCSRDGGGAASSGKRDRPSLSQVLIEI